MLDDRRAERPSLHVQFHQTGRIWYTERCLFNSTLSLKRPRLARLYPLLEVVGPFNFMGRQQGQERDN